MNHVRRLEKLKTVRTSLPVAQGLNLHSETLLAVASTENLLYSSPVSGTSWAASALCGEAGDSGSCHSHDHLRLSGRLRAPYILRHTTATHPLHSIQLLCTWDVLDLPLLPWPYTKDILTFPGHVLRVSSSPKSLQPPPSCRSQPLCEQITPALDMWRSKA